ncbi:MULTISPECIES: TRAP transporter large permease subunit [Comamonas]|uniref:TRAP transporter large permease subunit n=1 Tax=Comamonas avium TaxID=2762231 RepID=A0ABR8SAF5_9BURK|nr:MULTISPECIES: TRAP transporter large permease subunit [Comamonas]MBD7960459.1 TRAP transporter large permease subunit [Comamonas avium]MBD9401774.1 TRAP transporter large permease subunit [Comamonas sp. CMM02]
MEFLANNMAPIMFAGLICFLLLGFPVAFSLGACGLFFAVIGIELNVLPEALMQALPLRIYGIMQNETMLAIPFFTLMGLILERSGMAEDLLDTVGQLFGPIRGGVAIAVILVGAMLAATTGVVAASVISMGLISLPIMLRYGYDRRIASGVIAASGTLAQIIPPSLVLIILADQLGRSVGDLYKGAFIPGFMLVGFYMIFIFLLAFFKPNMVPALPPEARSLKEKDGSSGLTSLLVLTVLCVGVSIYAAQNMETIHTWFTGEVVDKVAKDETIVFSMCFGVALAFVAASINRVTGMGLLSHVAEKVTFVLIPPLLLIFLVLGTIFLGIATPTEGGAMGALGAIILALSRKRLNYQLLRQALVGTTKLSCFVMFILIGATIFGLTFQGVDGPLWVEHLLADLPGGQVGFLIIVNIMVFVLAFFLDFFELSFIVVPLLAPVADKLGIDLVWFGVLLAVNMQTSFMHPPFGFALFFLRSVAPDKEYTDKLTKKRVAPVTTEQIYMGAIPFLCIQLMMVGLIIAFPGIVSSGMDEKVDYDLDAIREQMESSMPAPIDFDNPYMEQNGSNPGSESPADDPLKAMQEAIGK